MSSKGSRREEFLSALDRPRRLAIAQVLFFAQTREAYSGLLRRIVENGFSELQCPSS